MPGAQSSRLKPQNTVGCALTTRWHQAPRRLAAQHMFPHRTEAQGAQNQNLHVSQQQCKRVPLGQPLVSPQIFKGSCPICFSVPEIPPSGDGVPVLRCKLHAPSHPHPCHRGTPWMMDVSQEQWKRTGLGSRVPGLNSPL